MMTNTRTVLAARTVGPVATQVRSTPVVAPSFSLSRVRWVNVAIVALAPLVVCTMVYLHMSKPVLEDSVQWVSVAVPSGGGYDLAIKAAYAQVGEYDMKHVDIRDLRYMAKEHNNNKALLVGTSIEVPVYTGTSKYRQ